MTISIFGNITAAMPRIARIVVIGCPHHITQRGNYQQKTFSIKADYENYLRWLSEYCKKYKLSTIAFCLMPNHVHFISIPQQPDSLSKTFNTCHMRYSQYYNKKNKNKGHLWQGRFYSCPLDEDHLYEAIRYVENNPVRAKIVKKAEEWQWSSASAHLSNEKINLVLENIGDYIDIPSWDRYLTEKQEDKIMKEIKSNTLTGRPSGNDSFISKIENMLGRRLRPLPEGRPWQKRKIDNEK
ncbi:MAG: transposase [Candidatus Omnitrophota bacterium]|nr:transposase [Candidatus Omnitrophota bacterium]